MSRKKSFFIKHTKIFLAGSQTSIRCCHWGKLKTWKKYGLKNKEEGIMLAGFETIWEFV